MALMPKEAAIGNHRFIFIGGLHRSGTTPLFLALREHPQVSGFRFEHGAEKEHEGQVHQTVYPVGKPGKGPGYFGLEESARLDENSDLATPANAEKLFSEWARHWDLSKPWLLEKSPPNLIKTRFLQRLFPRSSFLIIMRHPVAVSLATLKWMGWPRHVLTPDEDEPGGYRVRPAEKDDRMDFHESRQLYTESMLYTLFENWSRAHRRFLDDLPHLNRCMVIRYEDLVAETDFQYRAVLDFLGLEVEPISAEARLTDHNPRYFEEWSTLPADWLTPAGRKFLEKAFQEPFSRFGYKLNEPWCEAVDDTS